MRITGWLSCPPSRLGQRRPGACSRSVGCGIICYASNIAVDLASCNIQMWLN